MKAYSLVEKHMFNNNFTNNNYNQMRCLKKKSVAVFVWYNLWIIPKAYVICLEIFIYSIKN